MGRKKRRILQRRTTDRHAVEIAVLTAHAAPSVALATEEQSTTQEVVAETQETVSATPRVATKVTKATKTTKATKSVTNKRKTKTTTRNAASRG